MRHIVERMSRSTKYEEYGRVLIDADILCKLIIRALKEGRQRAEHRARAALCEARSHGYRLLLGNADVNELLSGRLAALFREAHDRRHASRDGHQCRILLHLLQEIRRRQLGIRIHIGDRLLARRKIEGICQCHVSRSSSAGRYPLPFCVTMCTTTG
mgnify:CR=1 FL=1